MRSAGLASTGVTPRGATTHHKTQHPVIETPLPDASTSPEETVLVLRGLSLAGTAEPEQNEVIDRHRKAMLT